MINNKIIKSLDKFINLVGAFCASLLIILVLLITFNVISRYIFNDVSIGLQELEWHLFGSIFMLGLGYAFRHDEHVRVDVFYEKFSKKAKNWVNILGIILFIFPFSLLILYFSWEYVKESFVMGEKSGDPGGLHYRWIIKSIIPLSFIYLILASIVYLANEIKSLKKA